MAVAALARPVTPRVPAPFPAAAVEAGLRNELLEAVKAEAEIKGSALPATATDIAKTAFQVDSLVVVSILCKIEPIVGFELPDSVVRGGGYANPDVAFMLDQCHNIENKIPGQIRSVLNVQEMTARALLVDRAALEAAQKAGDVLAANAVLMDAFYRDVRPELAEWRASRGLPEDPMAAFAASGYFEKITGDRVGGTQAGWGA